MNIILIQETNWIDRNVIQTHHLMERMVKRGHAVTVIDYDVLWPSREDRSIIKEKEIFENVNRVIPGSNLTIIRPRTVQIPLFCYLSWAINSAKALREFIHANEIDLILCATLTNSLPLSKIAHHNKIPFVYLIFEPYHAMVPQKYIRRFAQCFAYPFLL